ncbi:MAG TPA: metal ABC transporter permease [Candidatus Bathyarchaeia archaeon]|nr:metal ABC transporter permease [Candidatus Bathyarchaeia archaeon]
MVEALALSLLTGIFVGISAGYLGSLMVLKKMSLVADALSHVALPGLALGILFNFPSFLGAFSFLFASALAIWYLGKVTRLSYETIVGAVFTLALAVGVLMIPEAELLEALFGDITTVTIVDTAAAVIVSIVAVVLTRAIYGKLVLGMISEELAISRGIDVSKVNLLYLLLVSLVVAVGIKIVGTLLVGFLVIVPAAAAKNVSSDLSKYALLSTSFGVASACSGIIVANYLNIATGPLVVLSGIVVFIITVVAKWMTK